MASNFIDRIQIGNDQIAIGSSAYAICNTDGILAAKTATIPGFYLNEGTTIYIKFTSANTASNPTLNISNTGAIPIVQYGTTVAGTANETTGWEDGAVLSFTLTKENNNWYWSKVSGYSVDTNSTYSIFVQSGPLAAAGLVPAPGATAGSDLFLCEDGTWATPNYTTSLPLSAITNTTNLQIIENLTGTGLLEKTANGWELDTNTYLTSQNTAYLYATTEIGTSNASNETDPYLTLIDGATTSRIQLEGNGQTSIVADNGVITISTNITAADLGLSNAMHFIGIVASNSTYQPSDNTHPHPNDPDNPTSLTLEGNITYNSPNDGDVILDKDCIREYVWSEGENGSWKLLGFSASTDYTSVPGSNLNTEDIPQWIYQITQQTDGTVRAYYKTLGVIPVTHGGTGISVSPTQYGIVYGEQTNDSISYYTSTSAGENGKVLIGKGSSNAPEWYDGLLLTSSTTNNTTTYLATFSNNVSVGGTLGVIGATSLGSTLEVTGTSTLTGNVGIGGTPESGNDAHKLYVNGITNLNGNVDINGNLIPTLSTDSTIPNKTLGSSTYPWAALYIGDGDHGDEYTSVYWHEGVPTETSSVQRINFTFNTTHPSSLILSHNAITNNAEVINIVVTEGEQYLLSEITWEITSNNSTSILTLTASTNLSSSQAIIGYVIIAKTASVTPTIITPQPESEPSEEP